MTIPRWPYTPLPLRRYVIIERLHTGARKFKIWRRRVGGGGGGEWFTSISDSYYVLTEYIYPYHVLQRHYVEFVYESDILMRNWVEFIYTKLAKKKVVINLCNFLQIFLLVVETSSQTKKKICLFFVGSFFLIIQTIFLKSKYWERETT